MSTISLPNASLSIDGGLIEDEMLVCEAPLAFDEIGVLSAVSIVHSVETVGQDCAGAVERGNLTFDLAEAALDLDEVVE